VNASRPVRVGFGLGVGRLVEGRHDLAQVVDLLEALEFDSFWASDVPGSFAPDPVAALAFAAGRTQRLKLGSSVLIAPGFTPTRLAKQLATLDVLSDGRLFPVLGLGSPDPDVLDAVGVARAERGPLLDELLPLARRIWAEDEVTHRGEHFSLMAYRPQLRPVRSALSVWLGGRSESELQRAGRLADGWLASFATPEEVEESVPIVMGAAAEVGRKVPDDHIGVLLLYSLTPPNPEVLDFARWRRPDLARAQVIPVGEAELCRTIQGHVRAGASKFIVIPAQRPASWEAELVALREIIGPLQRLVAA
jgi:probable F420-dependent oxidoreductase